MVDFLVQKELPFIVVLTKADKLNKTETTQMMEVFRKQLPYAEELTIIPSSSEKGIGIEEIRAILKDVTAQEDE